MLENGASCWDLYSYRKGQTNALDLVQMKVAKFVNHTNDSGWETLVQRKKIVHICELFKAYTGEQAGNL